MRFGEKIVVFIFRPIYRTFFERLLWWFLTKIKIFMLAEISAEQNDIRAQLDNIEQRLRVIEEGQRTTNDAGQWDALEQLLLSLFRSSELRISDATWEPTPPQRALTTETNSNRVHAASNLR